jgi:hypothetical protein
MLGVAAVQAVQQLAVWEAAVALTLQALPILAVVAVEIIQLQAVLELLLFVTPAQFNISLVAQ